MGLFCLMMAFFLKLQGWVHQDLIRTKTKILHKNSLKCEEQKESHHETEESHGLGQGESHDGVGEQLLLEGGVPCISDNKRSKDRSNPSSDPATPTVAAPAPINLAAE